MWTPKQLLHEKIIDALYLGGFTTMQVEFLGWLSYTSAALNNSRNPVRAAHTLLAKANTIRMLGVFAKKKTETIAPKNVETHDEADQIFADLKDTIDTAIVKARMRATDYEDFTSGGVSDGSEPPEEAKAAAAGEEADG